MVFNVVLEPFEVVDIFLRMGSLEDVPETFFSGSCDSIAPGRILGRCSDFAVIHEITVLRDVLNRPFDVSDRFNLGMVSEHVETASGTTSNNPGEDDDGMEMGDAILMKFTAQSIRKWDSTKFIFNLCLKCVTKFLQSRVLNPWPGQKGSLFVEIKLGWGGHILVCSQNGEDNRTAVPFYHFRLILPENENASV